MNSIKPDFPVNITLIQGAVRVVPPDAHVSLTSRNSVVWHCIGCIAEIVFDNGSPFLADRFLVPAGGFVGSGPAVLGEKDRHYKYTVIVTELNGGRSYTLDPEVVVDE